MRLRDIAAEAGVTPAAVLYYGDVDALTYDTYQQAIERFSRDRERVAEKFSDARDRLRASIDHGVASGPDDELVRLLFEFWPRSLRDPKAAVLDSSLQEHQIAVYGAIFVPVTRRVTSPSPTSRGCSQATSSPWRTVTRWRCCRGAAPVMR